MATIITTVLLKPRNAIEDVRADLALKMILDARREGHNVLALDGGSEPERLAPIENCGARIVKQIGQGMGVARREAIAGAAKFFPNEMVFVWLEPEKVNMIAHLTAALQTTVASGCSFAFFNRTSLASYPPEQACAYGVVRGVASDLLGVDLDFMFGPVVFTKFMLHYFLNYDGKYGDKWDSIHIPKLRAINDGASYRVIDIDYEHPASQTDAEKGDLDYLRKRIEQASLVIRAMVKELRAY